MSNPFSDNVSKERLWERHQALARIGATVTGGVNRLALSDEDFAACRRLIEWGRSFGMLESRDEVGNLFLRLCGTDSSAAPVVSGSHLDSQPTGGKYDGVYGVLAALEACESIAASRVPLRRSIDVVAWMNEEGSRFAPGMMGSAVFAGARSLAEVKAVKDATGVSVAEALDKAATALADVPLRALGGVPFAYVEAHIEQGPVLERLGKTIGVVSGIQGKRTFRVVVEGEAAHAGTSLRSERKDALLAATAMVGALIEHIHDDEDVVKFTIGQFTVTPNAPSVVPSGVTFSIDLRHPDSDVLRKLGDAIDGICQQNAAPCRVDVKELSTAMSLDFPDHMRQRIDSAAARIGISKFELYSAAGHDARYLHGVCPSGMVFIPCHLGITHNEAESITPDDAFAGARVLAEVLSELAQLES
ncbi:Zn-dependent hydrolase [Trinickia symbiotica]|uniref:Zn-dependent hydrolase n=1 Tax=Trinickia symbiotica TaxID=863227 RepID=A0A2T3XQI6_9BURK|nr:M20 family metallo-hydrolase [Trinickia symbiotica]PTB18786.1 Zn-dependent hydrolase [Trinickia symbiotica]